MELILKFYLLIVYNFIFSHELQSIPNHTLGLATKTFSHKCSMSSICGGMLVVTVVSNHWGIPIAQFFCEFFGQPQGVLWKSFLGQFVIFTRIWAVNSGWLYSWGASFSFYFETFWFGSNVMDWARFWKWKSWWENILRVFSITKFKGLF